MDDKAVVSASVVVEASEIERIAKEKGIFGGAVFMEIARAKLHEKYGDDVSDEDYFDFMLKVEVF